MSGCVWLSWSSGKDSAWALWVLRQQGIEVDALFCTYNQEFQRVAMHGVRIALVREQAKSVGLPLHLIPIPYPCSNAEYEAIMGAFVEHAISEGVNAFAFGDLFLEDVRAYREKQLKGTGIEPVFPLWGEDTRALAGAMVAEGMRARVTCLDPRRLSPEWAGRVFDEQFLQELPPEIDPCGERGEFHTFVYQAPFFSYSIPHQVGETVEREGFVFTDLVPQNISESVKEH